MANLNPKRTKRCNQSSLLGTLKEHPADTVLQGMQPSAESLTGRPPDTVLQGIQPSARSLTGRPTDTVLQDRQPSAGTLTSFDTVLQWMLAASAESSYLGGGVEGKPIPWFRLPCGEE